MGALNTLYLKILLVLSIILEVQSRFIHFKPGYEYVYSFEGHSTVRDLGKFIVKAKVREFLYVLKVSCMIHNRMAYLYQGILTDA